MFRKNSSGNKEVKGRVTSQKVLPEVLMKGTRTALVGQLRHCNIMMPPGTWPVLQGLPSHPGFHSICSRRIVRQAGRLFLRCWKSNPGPCTC
jgi:hypothetical protein